MAHYASPQFNGIFRIRLYEPSSNSGNNYWQYAPDVNSGIQLKSIDTNNTKQMFVLNKDPDGSWRMQCVYDLSGIAMYKTAKTYWGHGYPLGGAVTNWTFQLKTVGSDSFSKIYCAGNSEPLDSCYGNYVHFYTESSTAPNQRWILEMVPTELWYGKNIKRSGQSTRPTADGHPFHAGADPAEKANPASATGSISTDPTLSITDNDGNELSKANDNLNPDTIYIVNNTNIPVKVNVANASSTKATGEMNDVILQPGEYQFWLRQNGFIETLAVYRGDNSGNFPSSPENYSANPGQITAII